LGAKTASGQMFRAIHVEQRKLLAVRVFAIPLGLTPESREEFAEQLEQLKSLRHEAIVRCYGGGFDSRTAYLVYELVDGESLDKVLLRRGRLPWETALEAAQQLTEALQYAHHLGWIHGRIRPEKLLLPHGVSSIKLADFRRDSISSMIGGGPLTVEEMLYMAPELFRPGAIADEKCDLYALGAVLYTLLVGEPPLAAATHDDALRAAMQDIPPTVNSRVLDCPIWLSAIVEQLLAKDPRQRPFSAGALQLAFKEAHRRQSQGVGVLQHATSGFSPLKLKADRAEAEKVLGIKKEKVRKEHDTPLWERPTVLISAMVLCIAALVWVMLPLGQRALRQRAERLLASQEWVDWNEARDRYLVQLTERFPQSEDAAWAHERIDYVNMLEAERRLDRNARHGRPPGSEAERRYLEARQYEQFGDRATALDMYRGIVKLMADADANRPIVHLAQRQIAAIEQTPNIGEELRNLLNTKLAEAERSFDQGDIGHARSLWESIVNLYRNHQEAHAAVSQAQSKLDSLKSK
jgi:eukaryotic-like serine/threonine-protein kinase